MLHRLPVSQDFNPTGTTSGHKATSEAVLRVVRIADSRVVLQQALGGRSWLIGRGSEAQIRLIDEAVSRSHAELRRCPFGRWWIHDLESTNGTTVNGCSIQSRILAPGDEIVVGGFRLGLEIVNEQDEAHATLPPAPAGDDDADLVLLAQASGRPAVGAVQLRTVMALGRRLAALEEESKRHRELCETLVRELGAHGALVVRLRGPDRPQLISGPFGGPTSASLASSLSRSVLSSLWKRREVVVAAGVPRDVSEKQKTVPSLLRASAVLACPIAESDSHVDAVYLSLSALQASEEWRALLALVGAIYQQAELVWQMRQQVRASAFVEHELETARRLQERLMPQEVCFEDLEVITAYQPCQWVGGDYVDAVRLDDGRVLLVIADVCGKGLQGALVTSSLHTLVRATVEGGERLPQLMGRMNRYLCRHLPEHSFVTLAAVLLDPKSGEIECVNAGHPPPLIADAEGRVRALQSGENLALGMTDAPFAEQRAHIGSDEVLLMYTDGLTELLDAERRPLSSERFSDGVGSIIAHSAEAPVAALHGELRRMLDDYRGARLATDDAAFLIARRKVAKPERRIA